MINKPIDQITIDDLKQLIQNSVLEGREIEYKEAFPSNSDSGKKEFLSDVSSFANANGGDLIIGVKEQNGTPKELSGVSVSNIDEEKLRLENMIRDGIEPRIQSSIKVLNLDDNKIVIIRITKSWNKPHRVIFKGHDKFYTRNSSGKYQMDTMELRTAFNLSETFAEKIRSFRTNRLNEIISNNTPVPLHEGGKIILHLIPLDCFSPGLKYNISSVANNSSKLSPINSNSGGSCRYNLDGILTYAGGAEDESYSYAQLYRNGIIEAVESHFLRHSEEKYIPYVLYEKELLNSLPKYLSLLQELNVGLPILIFLSLTGVKGYYMPLKSLFPHKHHKIDRNTLSLPEYVIESYDIDTKEILIPLFNIIWNACGLPRSLNFDDSGNWVES